MNPRKKQEFIKTIEETPAIEADFMVGLNDDEVKQRIADGLVNKVPKKVTKTYWEIFCDNFFSFFNMVFFGIGILMAAAQIRGISNYAFLLPIVCNIILGLITDLHARHLVDKLRLVTDPHVNVMRNGADIEVAVNEVVLSDIMVLSTGDQICADGVIVNGKLNCDESLLTGESEPILKCPGSEVLSGSFVKSGKAYVRVNRVGIANFAEGLQDSAQRFERPKSELKASSLKIFLVTGILSIALGIAMTATWAITTLAKTGTISFQNYHDFIRSTLSGSMEAMIPAGLYLLTSLTLALGVISLANKRMNVQELYSLEMLARVDTICFDKTGTLTDGKLAVKDFINYSNLTDSDVQECLASLCQSTGDDNATAKAIKTAYKVAPYKSENYLPFDSALKFSAATFEGKGTFIMGAPGFVDAVPNKDADAKILEMSKRGYRVVGIYQNKKPVEKGKIPSKSVLVALVSLSDHVKADAKDTIQWFVNNGVAVKVISGDSPITVSEIAREVGIPGADQYVSLEGVKDEDLPSLMKTYTIFGRVKPEQKCLLVNALQAEGHKVAMTGDGVNDILALKSADCSIAMASGSSAARNVAHIVSMDNDFSKLPIVVAEGRRVINNLQRTATLFLTKTVFAVILAIVSLIVAWAHNVPFAYPFNTPNMIVWELVTIGGGGLFLSLQPSKERLKGSYLINVLSKSAPGGLVAVIAVGIYYLISAVNPQFISLDVARTLSVLTFTALSLTVLFRICLPFDNYRTVVFVAMVLFAGLFFFIDFYVNIFQKGDINRIGFFGIAYNLNTYQIITGFGVFVGMVILYFFLDWGSRSLFTKREMTTGGKNP